MSDEKKGTSFKFEPHTVNLIAELREEFGLGSNVEVIRLALWELKKKSCEAREGKQNAELLMELRALIAELRIKNNPQS